jgi:hypothetical protein
VFINIIILQVLRAGHVKTLFPSALICLLFNAFFLNANPTNSTYEGRAGVLNENPNVNNFIQSKVFTSVHQHVAYTTDHDGMFADTACTVMSEMSVVMLDILVLRSSRLRGLLR